jgi:hypothetical protein
MRHFVVNAEWDADAAIYWAHSDEIPLTTEAATFEALVERVNAIAPEILMLNGLARAGERVSIRVIVTKEAELALA